MTERDIIRPDEFLDFLTWVSASGHIEAVNAAVDLHQLLCASLETLDEWQVYDAIFHDSPEADTVEVPGRSKTALIGQWLISAIQQIRAELPGLVVDYRDHQATAAEQHPGG